MDKNEKLNLITKSLGILMDHGKKPEELFLAMNLPIAIELGVCDGLLKTEAGDIRVQIVKEHQIGVYWLKAPIIEEDQP
jgi:hypothetical protein